MIRFAPVAGLVFLAACGLSESKFNDELGKASCEWVVECFDIYETVDECVTDNPPAEVPADCTYDAKKAKECLDAVKALTCESTAVPTVCGEVYDCPDDSGM